MIDTLMAVAGAVILYLQNAKLFGVTVIIVVLYAIIVVCFHRWYDHPDAIGRNGTGRLELPRPVSMLWRAETVEQEKLVQGWMVCGTEEEAQKPEIYFLDVNNAIAYREMQRDAASLTLRLQYIRPEWAKDLHKSRLRQRDGKQER